MKKRLSRSAQVATNPVAMALQARDYRDTLVNTSLGIECALQCLEAGTHTSDEIIKIAYLCKITNALGRAGFVEEGMSNAELSTMCKNALQSLNIGQLRHLSALHTAQLEVCTPTQYLRARQTL